MQVERQNHSSEYMVELSSELGSDTGRQRPDRQSVDSLEEIPHSDAASVNIAASNNDDQSTTGGALEAMDEAGNWNLDPSQPVSLRGQRISSLDVLVENHQDSSLTENSTTAANAPLPESIASVSSVRDRDFWRPPNCGSMGSAKRMAGSYYQANLDD
ncbi:MAG: hypothetical protein Q9216_000124 [Gyalolechia sp. 2 TL-2023]